MFVAGGINLHCNKVDSCSDCAFIKETLNVLGLVQHVMKATHQEGNILDWVISRPHSCVDSAGVGGLISDHFAVHCALHTSKPPVSKSLQTYRKFKNINEKVFDADILSSSLHTGPASFSVDEMVEEYNRVLCELVDRHAPEQTMQDGDCEAVPRALDY